MTIQTGFHNGGRNKSLIAYESGRNESFDCIYKKERLEIIVFETVST